MEQREEKLRSLVLIGSILALIGIALSAYSLWHHMELKQLGQTSFSCNINDALSCDDIAKSKWAEDSWGNPMGVYGVGYFLGLLALLITARVNPSARRDSLQAYAAMATIGVLVSLTLAAISHFSIGHLCPTCMGIYLITFVQFAVLVFAREGIPGPFQFKSVSNGGWYGVTALAVVVALYQILKPHPANLTLDTPKSSKTTDEVAPTPSSPSGHPGALALLDSAPAASIKIDFSAYSGLGEDYRKGSDDAKVKIVEFADFQCPACANAAKAMRQLKAEFGDRILVVFKNFPLESTCNSNVQAKMHQQACNSAILARCAGSVGKFWNMHDKLFDSQTSINETSIIAWAKELGLSDQQIKECKESKDILAKLQDDAKQASEAGLQGTPTIFINGRKYNGNVEFDALRAVVQALLEG